MKGTKHQSNLNDIDKSEQKSSASESAKGFDWKPKVDTENSGKKYCFLNKQMPSNC